jgi:penicillin-binding protein 1A
MSFQTRVARVGRGRQLLCVALAGALVAMSACELAPIDLKKERPLPLRSTIFASDGSILARLFKQNRSLARYRAIRGSLVNAVLAAEDARFFEHPGYDLKAIARAALANLREGEVVQGGSTITQQYVKNVYFRHPPRTLRRKARELRIAIELEKLYSKKEILERYLNTVYLGDGAYGVVAGAETFFDRSLKTLSLPQAALLAAVIKSPSLYNPRAHPRRARGRRNYILDRMVALGHISPARGARAKRASLGVAKKPPRTTTREPYFVEAVKREILEQKVLGTSVDDRERTLYKGGLKIDTTLEPRLQRFAEESVAGILNLPGDPQAALVAIRPRTGAIVAMVGGRDWRTSQVNLALGTEGGGSGRQPGSSFKPIALATALESGIPLDAVYQSSPATFTLDTGEQWSVGNAEGGSHGLMTLEDALVHSVNGVYARLALQIGGGQIASEAQLMGVESRLSGHPSIVLGTEEVSVVDMAAAYATLANSGRSVQPTTIKQITLPTGERIRPQQRVVERALAPGNAWLITKTLQEVVRSGTGTAANIGRPAAGKTGTTNDYADAWFVGYTPQLVTAVWVGYPQGRIPMTSVHGTRVYGGTLPARIWQAFMARAHAGLPVKNFEIPAGDIITVSIDPKTGLLAAPWCKGVPRRMLRQLAPTEFCPEPVPQPTIVVTPSDGDKDDKDDKDGKDDDDKDSKDDRSKDEPEPDETPEPSPSPTGEG